MLAFAVLALAAPTALVAPADAEGAIAFSTPVRVGPNIGEPGLRVGPDGTIWVHYPSGLYKSTDGGATWRSNRPSAALVFGGDADLAIMRDGTLAYSDLSGVAISTWKSTDASGKPPFVGNPIASNMPLVDRQWVESGPDPITGLDVAYLAYNQLAIGLRVMKSNTGGLLYEHVGTIPLFGFNCFRGNLDVSESDGAVYIADCTSVGPRVWFSYNGGVTWTARDVDYRTTGFRTFIFPAVQTDLAGHVYVAWVERNAAGTTTDVIVAGSHDRGLTWPVKVALTSPTSAGVMPWIAAGSDGRIGVSWYAADRQGNAGSMPDATLWRVKYAAITDFFGPARAIHEAFVSPDVVQQGFICGSGTGCNGGRNLLDFFQVAVDAQGRANVVYTDGCDGCTSPSTSRSARVTFARQTAGPLLYG